MKEFDGSRRTTRLTGAASSGVAESQQRCQRCFPKVDCFGLWTRIREWGYGDDVKVEYRPEACNLATFTPASTSPRLRILEQQHRHDRPMTPALRTPMSNPFSTPASIPGHGTIHLALLPPNTPRLRTVNYQYPLKLVSPAPLRAESEPHHLIHTVYLLTYGGGLVAGDCIDLHVILDSATRLILLTQGSTKLFKSPSREVLSKQRMTVAVAPDSSICYLPDPVQPFENSCFEQEQIYDIAVPADSNVKHGSICVLDWVSNGRPANGENWSFHRYGSRNEIYLCRPDGARRLLLRDNMLLDEQSPEGHVARKMDGVALYGTLILYGPLFKSLGQFFMDEFKVLPRIGGRKWDSGSESDDEEADPLAVRRAERQRLEAVNGLLWSAASVRNCIVVKLGAPTLEAARRWLFTMLSEEKTIVTNFGERALLCLR